ncbi:MAG: hypothetical protein A2945_02570 [Candidatus Liptonbacteria bacterium RIFCSPLOWO2_01_FULL_52_25]|uniref:Metallopeptidase family protein n=1 Tax=Candidatus Liptonbacteria bacterium RIFCSPLOWO2_01_FULL_52_25 TaxID=1798650 RepID=A0A1G2CEQ0_9BACT|nr:MAG: hypothetical protein A2945_02570 [Candidatus Liptonbacteria bacterium RIFCSPLOWO2_01_FULL_52_25]
MQKLKRAEFEKMVREGVAAIPEKFLRLLDNVALVIEDEPTQKQREDMRLHDDETLFGLYEGIPQGERGSGYGGVLPDKITIFKRPIEEEARSTSSGQVRHEEEIKKMVRDTVWHEIAHHFGMDERRVAQAEEKTAKKKN